MDTRELTRKFLDEILYANDYINREEKFSSQKHWGNWIEKINPIVEKAVNVLGENFFTDDFISMFCDGDCDDVQNAIKEHPCLNELSEALNDYFDWLSETIE